MSGGAASSPPVDDADADPDEVVDGRTARAQRTRDSIVRACVDLVVEGDIRPTAPRIAERAGVSVRSVFQHFDDLETLFAMVAEQAVLDLGDLVRPIDPDLSLAERVAGFTAQRSRLMEAVTPIHRAANVHAPFSPAIQARVAAGHEIFRAELETVFGTELDRAGERRTAVIDMLDVAAGWSSWEVLRTLDGRTVAQAVDVVAGLMLAALAPLADPEGRAG